MLMEIDKFTALKLYAENKEIKILRPSTKSEHLVMYDLDEFLKGCLYLVDSSIIASGPAESDESNNTETYIDDETLIDSILEVEDPTYREPQDKISTNTRGNVDIPKLCALHNAGWSVSKIADELNIGKSTVYYYIKKRKSLIN